jgi:MerR family transcriptional regulator, repressor of the yfmOP operon
MTAAPAAPAGLRIGEVARRVGTTPRTIRYYEELGLLPAGEGRASGAHRVYGERDVERLRDALRLKELLGVSLDELRELLEAEEARALLRKEWQHGEPDDRRRREILEQSHTHLDRQLALVGRRRDEIVALERELLERRGRVAARLAEMG